MQIGDKLASGEPHDGRAPDYDDWKLNADIIVYYRYWTSRWSSSMGIRVDADALRRQLKLAGCEERAELPFQKAILENDLPFTIGGGIGQSRICMFYLRKAHIGEVQCSIWPDEIIKQAAAQYPAAIICKIRCKAAACHVIPTRQAVLFTAKMLHTLNRCFRILIASKSGQAEIALTTRSESGSRCADDVCLLQQVVKELPGSHLLRRLQPDIRRIYASIYGKACFLKPL